MTGAAFDIRLAGPEDHADIAFVNQAMDRHYNPALAPNTVEEVTDLLRRIERDRRFGTQFALARRDGQPMGFAVFAVIHPGRRLNGLIFLKDLFVVPEARNLGLGDALMRFLARFARDNGIGRIDLTAEPHNAGAMRLYERLGMTVRPAVYYRLDGEGLARLAGSPPA
ncbi:GNAT family N-acetyltransferase [Phreatobacter sp. AB_2022a]|uniref:GNAT family N-acetyltransferase n=1 Tax=Phreatobacter sp. AB_2022a TaxID=3003134 RepID=UPI00228764F7|nr:GNAT family N-acetyltransferase [Phreatobacter sp. AB_2022a]MCZ0735829.1 GNAT family N-acetyltransferase [Phreatobacter sp. AB_2022a]